LEAGACRYIKELLKNTGFEFSLRTRDIDFLIPSPRQIRKVVDMVEMLKDMGFIVKHSYPSGYIKFEHPDLII